MAAAAAQKVQSMQKNHAVHFILHVVEDKQKPSKPDRRARTSNLQSRDMPPKQASQSATHKLPALTCLLQFVCNALKRRCPLQQHSCSRAASWNSCVDMQDAKHQMF
jgi:hypothetical protein